MRVKLAKSDDGSIVGMIHYIPVQYAPIIGNDSYYIYCIWVHGYKQGVGIFMFAWIIFLFEQQILYSSIAIMIDSFSKQESLMQKQNMLEEIHKYLQQNSDEKTKNSGKNFFKESVNLYGVKSAVVHKIGKEYFKKIKNMKKAEIFELCEALLRSGYLEEAVIACDWAYAVHKQYEEEDLKIFEIWINNYVSNWAACDTLCNHSVGAFIEMYPVILNNLKKWAVSENRWMRRASAVSLIIPAKNGRFLEDIFEIAEILLDDNDDLVQKGYGWMLKAASEMHQKEVFEFVLKHKDAMPRTSLRYAIEKLPKDLRDEVMR